MEFKEFSEKFQENFKKITKDVGHLFTANVDRDELWELYLDSFPTGTNDIFRERRFFDCSCCRTFIKNMGAAVIIKDNKVKTIWDFKTGDATFDVVLKALNKYVKSKVIRDIFLSAEKKVGTNYSRERLDSGVIRTWHHFYLALPKEFVNNTSRTLGDIMGSFRDVRNVFKRSLDEISMESVDTVLELIVSNTLYKGTEWKAALSKFWVNKKAYDKLNVKQKEFYAWEQSVKIGGVIGKIRNHSIGTLLVNISEGMDLDTAVKKYEAIIAPSNYKRPKAIFTKKMLENAKKTMEELGFMDSLHRRFATLDDITINNILFSNKDSAKRIVGDVFDDMKEEIGVTPKKFSKVEEVSIDKFITSILPTAKELEVLLENKHATNMVSLIAPAKPHSKSMFKWDNKFGWAYSGNITDSTMKENVKSAGGKVDGVLRFSIQWNDVSSDRNDLDAHCKEPGGNTIMFSNLRNRRTGGNLDVDITNPQSGKIAVENITWPTRSKMDDGTYQFMVHQYANRGGKDGFRAEIEYDGQIFSFDYTKQLRQGEKVIVAEVTLKKGIFSIKEKLPSSVSTREIWGVKSNQFVPVSVLMNSPNYWDEQEGIGHKHFFFMLKKCVNDEKPNGFYNEFLKQDLDKHKRVFEALGGKMAVEDVEDQLSGIGFSSTKRSEVIVKVKGNTERVLKIKF